MVMTLWSNRRLREIHLFVAAIVFSRALGNGTIGDRLLQEVWKDYQKDVRPICGAGISPVHATLGIAIRQLIEMNEPEQKMSTSIWFRTAWNDCRLDWDPSDYGGLSRVTVPKHRMWVPDLTLYDNAQSKLGEQEEYQVSVTHDGEIIYNLPAVVKSMCKLNVAMFPFDYQTCYLTLGSWIYNQYEVNFTAREINAADLTSYIPHGEWDLYKLDVENYSLFAFDDTPYAQVIFTVHLRRKPLFHTINLILPSVIVKSLAIVGFILPPESGEKLNLEITVLLSLLVFQLVILNSMPHSSNHMPVIATYFLLSMILIALSCLCTVVVLNIHYNKHHTMLPAWIRDILTGRMGRLLHLDEIMGNTHAKLQRLQAEYKQVRPRKNLPSSKAFKSSLQKASAPNNHGPFLQKFNNLSLRSRKSKDVSDDSIYGFYPSARNGYATELYSSRPQRYSASSQAEPISTATSFLAMNMSELRVRESEPQEGDSPAVSVNRQILAQLERRTTHGIKKQISNLLEAEWKIFAVFLDRLFLFTFLLMGLVVGVVVFAYIAS